MTFPESLERESITLSSSLEQYGHCTPIGYQTQRIHAFAEESSGYRHAKLAIASEDPMERAIRHIAAASVGLAFAALAGCAGPEPFHIDEATRATPATLTVADRAPPLHVRTWVVGGVGEPLAIGNTGKVTLVSFFATWCAPCRAVTPRLEQLHRDMGDTVDVIEVATLDSVCTASQVRLYIRENPWITMRVAIDDGVKTAHAYRAASREDAIPRSFVIDRDGRLAWIGHPADARPVLERVIAGDWDFARERAKRDAQMAASRELDALFAESRESPDQSRNAAIARYQRMVALEPRLGDCSAPVFQHRALVQALAAAGRADDALAAARRSLEFKRVQDDHLSWLEMANAIALTDPALAAEWADEGWRRYQALCTTTPKSDAWDLYMAQTYREDPQAHVAMAQLRAQQRRFGDAAAHLRDAIACTADVPEFAAYRAELQKTLQRYEAAQ